MLKVTRRNIIAHLPRFLLTMLAVALGIAFLSGTLSLRTVLAESFTSMTASTRTADAYVLGKKLGTESTQGTSWIRSEIDPTLADSVRGVDGVRSANPEYFQLVVLMQPDGTVLRGGYATGGLAVTDEGMTLSGGRAPSGDAEIGLVADQAKTHGIDMGDQVRVAVAGEARLYTVTALYDLDSDNTNFQSVFFPPEQAATLLTNEGKVQDIAFYVHDGEDVDAVVSRVADALGSDVEVMSSADLTDEDNASIEEVLGFVNTFLLVFVVLAIFVGTFIIGNTFQMAVAARRREFALMRAVGVSSGQVFWSVAVEAIFVGLVGSVFGVLLGAGLVAGLAGLLGAIGFPLDISHPMSLPIAAMAIIVGTVVTLVAALLPARKAARTAPIEAMRIAAGVGERSVLWRTILGGVIAVTGIVLIVAAANGAISGDFRGPLLGVGAAAFLIGVLALLPALAKPIVWLLAWPFRIFRPQGRLALRNVDRAPRRVATTSGALVIGMALVAAGAMLASSVRASTADSISDELRAPLVVQPLPASMPTGLSEGLVAQLTGVDGVESVNTSYKVGMLTVLEPGQSPDQASPVFAGRYDQAETARDVSPEVVSGDLNQVGPGKIAVSDKAAPQDLGVGDTVTLVGGAAPLEVEIAARYSSEVLNASALIDAADFDQLAPAQVMTLTTFLRLDTSDSQRIGEIQANVEDILKATYTYQVLSADDLQGSLESQINRTMSVLYGLLGLSIIIAILGIVNTLSLSVTERTKEIGLMRAVGLGRGGIAGTITIESVLITTFGAVIGVVSGCLLGWGLLEYLSGSGVNTIVVPWGSIIGLAIASGIIGVLAAIVPAVRAARRPILEAISDE